MKKLLIMGLMLTMLVGFSAVGMAAEEELTMWTWKVAYTPGFEAAAAAFEEKTGVKINIEVYTPDDAYRQRVTASANADTLPDIINWWGSKGEGVENALLELSTEVDQEFKDRLYSSSWDSITVSDADVKRWDEDEDASNVIKELKSGEFYGVPLDVGGFFTFYGNRNIIEEAGLEVKAPATWEEFINMMVTIEEETGTPGLVFGAQLSDLWQNWCGNALMAMYYGPEGFSDLLAREAKLSDPKNMVVLEAAYQLVENDLLLPGILSLDIDAADQAFAANRAAFNLGGSFTMSTLLAMGMDSDDIIAFPVPPIEDSEVMEWQVSPFLLTMLSVNKNSDNSDIALDFIEFVTSGEGAVLFANGAFTIPATDLSESEKNELNSDILAMVNSFSYEEDLLSQVPEYPTNFWENAEWESLNTMMQRMFSNEATPEEVAARFDDIMEQESE